MAPVRTVVALLLTQCIACRSEAPSERANAANNPAVASATGAHVDKETAPQAANLPLKVGDRAPELTLQLDDGTSQSLSQLRGKYVILYFYPKDDTPGCRIEAQQFRDSYKEFETNNAIVVGVSLQDAASHRAFIDKESLPFHLAVDRDATLPRVFGVPFSGEYASRQTVLLDPEGKVARIWRKVSPAEHAGEILAWLKEQTE